VASIRPRARTQGFLTEEVNDELRVYDEEHDAECRLNAGAALVWRNCDGERTVADLAEILREELGETADEDLVMIALDDLLAHGLILSGYEKRPDSAARLSRRRFLRRVGIAGAAAMAVPIVYSTAVPTMAAAAQPHLASVSGRAAVRQPPAGQGRADHQP
jgi:hypothetical protein